MNTVKSLLNQLCGTSDDVRGDIETQLKKHFIDPFYISRSQALPDDDILKNDARIVSDAFEAVTNGMYDEWVHKDLSKIPDSSFFADWKYLTESLYYLYEDNFKLAEKSFGKINEDSVPYLTAPVFYRIISREKILSITGLTETERSFIDNIIKDSINIKTSLSLIENNLKAGQEDRFIDNLTLLLSDLCVKDRNLSKKLASWGLKQLSLNDMSPSLLLENLKHIFGESETYRLTAVSFREDDPELSLLFFTKSLLIQIRNSSAEQLHVEAYIEILSEILTEIENEKNASSGAEDDSEDEMAEQISNILTVLEREINLHYPSILSGSTIKELSGESPVSNDICGIDSISGKKSSNIQPETENTDNKNPAAILSRKGKKAVNPVQLELFF